MAKVSDPLGRQSAVRFEVTHAPSLPEQGKGVIWSGEDTHVTSGTPAMVRVPKGKLRDGWKVRWRAQAIARGAKGPWSEWQTLTIGRQGGAAAKSPSIAAIPRPVKETPPAPAARIYDRIDTDECFNKWATAGKPQGWIKNHFSWCQIGRIEATQTRYNGMTSGKPPIEEDYYRTYVMLIAYTFSGTTAARKARVEPRDIVVEAFLFDQQTYGTMPLNRTMVLGMDIGNKPQCQHISAYNGAPHTNYKSLTVSQWKATPTGRATFRFRCAADQSPAKRQIEWGPHPYQKLSIDNEEKVGIGTLSAYANFPDWPKAINKYISNTNQTGIGTTVRCDSATYVQYKGGCVFSLTLPWVKFHWGKGYDQAFNHYWNACTRPGLETYPTDTSKAIHGCRNPNIPTEENKLHREYQNIRNANQSQTNRWCNNMWPGYANNGAKQCDEYPFASTRERTNVRNNKTNSISLCPVDTADNGAAGLILDRHYYQKDRILIGDAFYTTFEQAGMGTQKDRASLCGSPSRDYWP
ncbi:NucA/NucB deoxyribonuclease domain-containing protein [Nonomuraea sp. NPDC004702]